MTQTPDAKSKAAADEEGVGGRRRTQSQQREHRRMCVDVTGDFKSQSRERSQQHRYPLGRSNSS